MRKEMFKGLKISKDVKEALATVEEDLILVEETGGDRNTSKSEMAQGREFTVEVFETGGV